MRERDPNSTRSKIRKVLESNLAATDRDVQLVVPCHSVQVSQVRRDMGITALRYCKVALSSENFEFVSTYARDNNLTPVQVLDAIVTDTRMEST